MVAVQDSAPWGLARIDQRARLSLARLAYDYEPQDGTGVNVYVLDTGIDTAHGDFGGRAEWGPDTVGARRGLVRLGCQDGVLGEPRRPAGASDAACLRGEPGDGVRQACRTPPGRPRLRGLWRFSGSRRRACVII